MIVTSYDGLNSAWLDVLRLIEKEGRTVNPRGQLTKELDGVAFRILNSRDNTLVCGPRHLSHKYLIAEWLWIMFGRSDVDSILPFNKALIHFTDDLRSFAGAYGPMLAEQWSYAKSRLQDDRDTRQAVISIWRPRPRMSRDIPCTVAFQFLIRDNQLHMITTMRSNDAWLGLPYDVFTFTQLQAFMAFELDMEPGWYQHQVGSMHLYDVHFRQAELARQFYDFAQEHDVRRLERSAPLTQLPPRLEQVFLEIGNGRSAGMTFGADDLKNACAELLIAEDSEWATYVAAMMGLQHGRFKLIRDYEANL